MLKKFKMLAIILTVSLSINAVISTANAAPTEKSAEVHDVVDYYANEVHETINIEGEDYTYYYYLNENGNRSIDISFPDNSVQTIEYDQELGKIFLDEECVGNVEEISGSLMELQTVPEIMGLYSSTTTDWVKQKQETRRITWQQGTTAAVVAGLIATALGVMGASTVLAAMGAGTVAILAASCAGGTVYTQPYTRLVLGQMKVKLNWWFVASTGDRLPKSGTYVWQSP